MKKLRLFLTEKCNRNCEGCCNKDYDYNKIEFCNSYADYDEIMITGGEPLLLSPNLIIKIILNIRRKNKKCKIYLYTALTKDVIFIYRLLKNYIDGICVTLHEQKDVNSFNKLYFFLQSTILENKSLRLNIFNNVKIEMTYINWIIKKNIEWIKNCPLPKNEVLLKYKYKREGGN